MKLKAKYDFFTRCQTPELATEITVMPIRQIGPDAAILFSDILVVLQAMNIKVEMKPDIGPWIPNPIRNRAALDQVIIPHAEEALGYVLDAVKMTKQELNNEVPLIGFAGSPWTLLCYAVQGQGSKTFDKAKEFCFTEPEMAHELLQKITDTTIDYLKAKAVAGVNALQIFDSWGGLLNTDNYINFSLNPMKEIINNLRNNQITKNIPIILFTRGGGIWLNQISESGCNAIGLDWTTDISTARRIVGENISLQGNLDPCALHGTEKSIKEAASKILDSYGFGHRHIFNLGHGIDQYVDPENLGILINHVKEYSKKYHQN